MNGFPVLQGDDAQHAPGQLRDSAPISDATVRLNFPPQRAGEDAFTPFASNVRPLAQHLLFEGARRLHDSTYYEPLALTS